MASDKSKDLYEVLLKKGFREELCREIAFKYMNTDYTATRMLGYVFRASDIREEQLIDEMLCILEDRERFRKKHEMERAQRAINRLYEDGVM